MKKELNYSSEYEKITGEQSNSSVYLGPEEEAKRIEVCTILEPIEISYSNYISY